MKKTYFVRVQVTKVQENLMDAIVPQTEGYLIDVPLWGGTWHIMDAITKRLSICHNELVYYEILDIKRI